MPTDPFSVAVVPAIIAALISLLVGVLSFVSALFVARWQTKTEVANSIRQMQSTFASTLIEKRMEVYALLWPHIDSIYGERRKDKSDEDKIARNKAVLKEMRHWYRQNGMYFSQATLKAYYELENSLKIHPQHKAYDATKLKKIEDAKNAFKQELKADIGLLDQSVCELSGRD